MDQDELRACDFAFRAPDDDGVMTRFDALFGYFHAASGTWYLVYTDANPDENDEVGTYASIVRDADELERAIALSESGCTPKKPPVLTLDVIEDRQEWDLIERILDEVEQEDDD